MAGVNPTLFADTALKLGEKRTVTGWQVLKMAWWPRRWILIICEST